MANQNFDFEDQSVENYLDPLFLKMEGFCLFFDELIRILK